MSRGNSVLGKDSRGVMEFHIQKLCLDPDGPTQFENGFHLGSCVKADDGRGLYSNNSQDYIWRAGRRGKSF